MSAETLALVLVVATALGFDFTNGFHDTGNAMAASIATGALKPRVAVAVSAVMNLLGAFLSVSVALTVTNAVVKTFDSHATSAQDSLTMSGDKLLAIVLAGLIGGIVWNMLTWLLGLPSSSSHALLGGLIGATIVSSGWEGVNWVGDGTKLDGVVGKILLPGVASPVVAVLVACLGTFAVFRIVAGVAVKQVNRGFRWGQVGTASLVSLAHGTNDAQKTMGVITLALIATGHWNSLTSIPLWVKVVCAVAIALGTYLGGWRIIRTLGKGLVDIEPRQGVAADASTAAVILASSHLGFALSTTHVASGSIVGAGLGKPGASVRWSTARRMVGAWLLTVPAAAIVGGTMWIVGHLFGLAVGSVVEVVVLLGVAGYLYLRSRRQDVGAHNVTDAWEIDQAAPNVPADLVRGGNR
ncbi:inorganic phosphate transporter [Nocardioides sp. Iso805N]|uniref:inorganic phosphate transporter n=1 Tax=Nocardioides sp. Iso805N TaxID=1283287 RepID=UPI00037754E2|nr:inorganic phosphate transporter [Nocardioides sp. Iso805N]